MDEVSNNILLFLAILAIGISVFGIYTTITNMGPTLIGGAAIGTANVTIQTATTITINPANINFTQSTQGQLKNSSENTDVSATCSDFLCGINITNDGNVLIDVQLTVPDNMFDSLSANATSMMCRVCNNTLCGNNFNKGTGATTYSTNTTYINCTSSAGNVGGDTAFIDALNYTNQYDNAYVDVQIIVPDDEPIGLKGAVLSFTAAQN